MTQTGRVLKKEEIFEYLTDDQIKLITMRLREVMDHGFGKVIITVNYHHVSHCLQQIDEKIREEEEATPLLNPDFGKR